MDHFFAGTNRRNRFRESFHHGRFVGCLVGSNELTNRLAKRNWTQSVPALTADGPMVMNNGPTKLPKSMDFGSRCDLLDGPARNWLWRIEWWLWNYYPRPIFFPASHFLSRPIFFPTPSKKGTGYVQPTKLHQEWHVDVSYINVGGTFYFLISVLDGFSRYIVHQELRETMKELDIELVIAKEIEKHPGVKPRIIGDNGPQFIAKDFKEFVRQYGLTHVRTSPYYPQSNGKIERWHGSLKSECIRPSCPATKAEAEKRIASYVQYYNTVRLHSALGYITPADCLAGLCEVIGQERDRKLESARKLRQEKRVAAKEVA
jgi:putative transposase